MNFLRYLNDKTEKLNLLFVCSIPFFLAVLSRVAFLFLAPKFSSRSIVIDDSIVYLKQASNILHGQWAGQFPNGYPLIISLFSFLPNKEMFLVGLNILLSSFIACLVVLIVYKRTSAKLPALISGLVVAFWYNQINWSTIVLSEAPTAFFVTLGAFLMMGKKDCWRSLFMGIASVIRTTLLPIGFIIAIYRRSYKIFLAFLVPFVIMLLIGYCFTGGFSIGNNLAENIYISVHLYPNGQMIWGFPHGISTPSALKVYTDYFLDNPIKFIYQRFQQFWILWGPWPFTQTHSSVIDLFLKLIIGLRFPLLFFGLLFYIISKDKNNDDFLFLTPILVLTLVHTALFASIRYTHVVEPLLIALFFSHFYFFIHRKQWLL